MAGTKEASAVNLNFIRIELARTPDSRKECRSQL